MKITFLLAISSQLVYFSQTVDIPQNVLKFDTLVRGSKRLLLQSFNCPDCNTNIPGTNCAHTLARLLEMTDCEDCVSMCPCGYPVRAKEIRDNVYDDFLDNDRKSNENAFIYAETNNGGGHVYYGTFTKSVIGNGLSASGMSSVKKFQRYKSIKCGKLPKPKTCKDCPPPPPLSPPPPPIPPPPMPSPPPSPSPSPAPPPPYYFGQRRLLQHQDNEYGVQEIFSCLFDDCTPGAD